MGRKSSSKGQSAGSVTPASTSGTTRMWLGAIVVAIVGIGVFVLRSGNEAPGASAAASSAPGGPAATAAKAAEPTAESIAAAQAAAALGPHTQANLPPIPFRGYAPPRPPEVVTAAFHFAAEHPEVASYVPCFCGCQQSGHRGNADCFVKARAANGDVVEWEEHGLECAVCIDVATRSRQMNASGASVPAIRAAIEKEFAPSFPSMTPTPKPPAAASHGN
jgi:hypothetical protein